MNIMKLKLLPSVRCMYFSGLGKSGLYKYLFIFVSWKCYWLLFCSAFLAVIHKQLPEADSNPPTLSSSRQKEKKKSLAVQT